MGVFTIGVSVSVLGVGTAASVGVSPCAGCVGTIQELVGNGVPTGGSGSRQVSAAPGVNCAQHPPFWVQGTPL